MKFLYGFIAIAIGFLLIWKSNWLVNNVGRVGWADQHLGTEGGSNLFYKLIGIVIMLITFMALTGALPRLLGGIFGASIGPTE